MNAVRTATQPEALHDPGSPWSTSIWHAARVLYGKLGGPPSNRGFAAMLAAYRASGGTARGDDLARRLEDRRRGECASLARLIASGQLFGFEWRHTFWVPMFQLEPHELSIKAGPQRVLAELASVFDGWALATWFAQPSCWLNGRRPVELLDSHLPAVVEAARVDRFIAAG